MSARSLLQHLRKMSTSDRLALIEEASRLIREDLARTKRREPKEDPILRVVGCFNGRPLSSKEIDEQLYRED